MNVSTNSLGSQPLVPDQFSFRRGGKLAAVTSTQSRPVAPSPERKLWTSILVAIYKDVAREGPYWSTYRDAVRSKLELEEVAMGLGYPHGSIDKLLSMAVAEWKRSRRAVGLDS